MVKELSGLQKNLRTGLRLLIFRQVSNNDFHVSNDQVLLLTLVYTLVAFISSYVLSLPKPDFSTFGLMSVATQVFAIALASYLIIKNTKYSANLQRLIVVFLSVWSWFYLIWVVVGAGSNFSMWELHGKQRTLYLLYNFWMLMVFVVAAARVTEISLKNVAKCVAAYLFLLLIPLHNLSLGQFWYQQYDYEDANKYAGINQENVYYSQFDFIDSVKSHTLRERPGISDIYFVGFGSYGSQDVFMKEVQYAKNLFDEKFDTRGRSVALINNLKTFNSSPLASKNNLNRVINHIGEIVNVNEDILFLYLTSHGSKKHKLSVEFASLALNDIDPVDLNQILSDSGIKYRVLLISACYSGGFVEPLKNENTLVMTASAPDRQSFGCGNKSEFTYFGKAIFQEQLENNYDMIDAFKKSIVSIREREIREGHKPSNPQLFIGSKIESKLRILQKELAAL